MAGKASYVASLVCGHSKFDYREFGRTTYCLYCQAERYVTKSMAQFYVQCVNCRYARNTGVAQFAARRLADRHARNYPTHAMRIWRANELWEDRVPYGKMMQLEMPDDPPF